MKIIGIDPGTRYCGFAVLEVAGTQVKIADIGVWDLVGREKIPLGVRLEQLHREAGAFFQKWNPHLIGLEYAVHHKNVKSAMVLSEARGILRLAAHQKLDQAEARIKELSPTAVKKHAAGWGNSKKEDVSRILSFRFQGLKEFLDDANFRLDALDALGIAWTTWILHRSQIKTKSHGVEHRS